MLRLITTLARVAFGFALASIAAGLVTVMFVDTPVDVLAQPASRLPQTASETLDLALLTATHSGIFSAAFVLIAAGLGEWLSMRSLPFYLIAGMGIGLLGFIAQFSSEVAGQPTILNNYALKAFLTAGLLRRFRLLAGIRSVRRTSTRGDGRRHVDRSRAAAHSTTGRR